MEKMENQPTLFDNELQINRISRPAFRRLYLFLLEAQQLQKKGERFCKGKLEKKYKVKANFDGGLPDLRNVVIDDAFVKSLYIQRREYRKFTKDENWKNKDGKPNHIEGALARMKDFLIGVKELQRSGVYPKGLRKLMIDCRIGVFSMSIIPDLRNVDINEELVERMMDIRHEYYKCPKTFSIEKYYEKNKPSDGKEPQPQECGDSDVIGDVVNAIVDRFPRLKAFLSDNSEKAVSKEKIDSLCGTSDKKPYCVTLPQKIIDKINYIAWYDRKTAGRVITEMVLAYAQNWKGTDEQPRELH